MSTSPISTQANTQPQQETLEREGNGVMVRQNAVSASDFFEEGQNSPAPQQPTQQAPQNSESAQRSRAPSPVR
ncbi:MAG: hypothetical protein JKY15_07440 [Deltaproteobacteria bacterium]|nr:hypothetical protein [Deltaproteobacteria bacterium]